MRRLVATALLVALGSAPGSASAHEEHDFGITVDPVSERDSVAGLVRIRGRIFLPEGVERWSLEVRHPAGAAYPGFGQHQSHESERRVSCPYPYPKDGPAGGVDRNHPGSSDGERKTVTVDCSWDTRTYGDDSRSFNGEYLVVLTAWNAEAGVVDRAQTEPHGSTFETTVANPAAQPAGLVTAYSDASAQVTLNWATSPEPDLTGYVLQEQVASGEWTTVEEPGPHTGSLVRQLTRAGVYRYRLAAKRPDGSGGQLRSSWATPEDGPDPVVVSERGGGLTDPNAEPPPEAAPSDSGDENGVSHDASIRPEPGADTSLGAARAAPPVIAEPPRRQDPDQRPTGLDPTTPEGDSSFSEELPYQAGGEQRTPVSDPEVAAPLGSAEESSGSSLGLIVGGLLLLVLATAGFLVSRKARQAPEEA